MTIAKTTPTRVERTGHLRWVLVADIHVNTRAQRELRPGWAAQIAADFDPDRILSHQARFSSPVLPGQTLTVEMWRDENEISFQARVKESGRLALSNGKCVLRKP